MRLLYPTALSNCSRREFFVLAGAGLYTAGRAAPAGITARQVIERIQKNVGVPWRSETVDTFKIGDPETIVKGIATSFGATLDVCRRAQAAGLNLLIVHEPTFYNHNDETASLGGEIYEAKRGFIEKNGLVVWRFHDHWHARKPDGILAGMTEALGWGEVPIRRTAAALFAPRRDPRRVGAKYAKPPRRGRAARHRRSADDRASSRLAAGLQ